MSSDDVKDVNPSKKITRLRLVQHDRISAKGKIKCARPNRDKIT